MDTTAAKTTDAPQADTQTNTSLNVTDGGGQGSDSKTTLTSNSRAEVPEGMKHEAFSILPVRPAPAPSSPFLSAGNLSIPSSNQSHSNHPRGPVPEKGSGQDRFRQLLDASKENRPLCSTSTAQSGSSSRPMAASRYSPGFSAPNPPPFAGCATTSTNSEMQGNNGTMAQPRMKTELPQAPMAAFKAGPLTEAKPTSMMGKAQRVQGDQQGQKAKMTQADVRNHPLATARLSAECQLRHFNPKWHEISSAQGFKCNVQLVNKVIHGDSFHKSLNDAKQAVAKKALAFVRRLPREEAIYQLFEEAMAPGRTDRLNEVGHRGPAKIKGESPLPATRPASAFKEPCAYPVHIADNAAYNEDTPSYGSDQQEFVGRIQAVLGEARPSPAVLADPLAAQAFLQGLVLGTAVRPAGLPYRTYAEPQNHRIAIKPDGRYSSYDVRERSPVSNVRLRRERSPLRRRAN